MTGFEGPAVVDVDVGVACVFEAEGDEGFGCGDCSGVGGCCATALVLVRELGCCAMLRVDGLVQTYPAVPAKSWSLA